MKQKNKTKFDCNESVVVMSAVRYMLGRASYGVACICDYLQNNKDRLTDSNIQVIIRDIQEYADNHPYMKYRNDWLAIVNFLIN